MPRYDTGGDSFSAIFSDFFQSVADSAPGVASLGPSSNPDPLHTLHQSMLRILYCNCIILYNMAITLYYFVLNCIIYIYIWYYIVKYCIILYYFAGLPVKAAEPSICSSKLDVSFQELYFRAMVTY